MVTSMRERGMLIQCVTLPLVVGQPEADFMQVRGSLTKSGTATVYALLQENACRRALDESKR